MKFNIHTPPGTITTNRLDLEANRIYKILTQNMIPFEARYYTEMYLQSLANFMQFIDIYNNSTRQPRAYLNQPEIIELAGTVKFYQEAINNKGNALRINVHHEITLDNQQSEILNFATHHLSEINSFYDCVPSDFLHLSFRIRDLITRTHIGKPLSVDEKAMIHKYMFARQVHTAILSSNGTLYLGKNEYTEMSGHQDLYQLAASYEGDKVYYVSGFVKVFNHPIILNGLNLIGAMTVRVPGLMSEKSLEAVGNLSLIHTPYGYILPLAEVTLTGKSIQNSIEVIKVDICQFATNYNERQRMENKARSLFAFSKPKY